VAIVVVVAVVVVVVVVVVVIVLGVATPCSDEMSARCGGMY